MAYSDFRDKMKLKSAEAKLKYYENSSEAWDQIQDFVTDPTHWIVAGIALLLIVAGIFAVKFLGAIRAPELTADPGPVTLGEPMNSTEGGATGEELQEIDDSNTEQPMLTGARSENHYTFLLFGVDKVSTSTDTIMVVSYDVANQKLNLMSIPRDTMVNVSWDLKKINSVYAMGGEKLLQKHIGKLIGFIPDYYVKIDLQAFVDVVDLLGGVEFDVPIPMHYHDPAQSLSIDLDPGLQTLTGEQAMGLVRFRKSDRSASGKVSGYDDTGRVQTQQAFLKAMFKKCLKITNWTKITSYVEIFEKNVESDLTLGNMLWFARQAMNLGEDGFTTCTAPGNYFASAWSRSTQGMQSYVTLSASQMVTLVNKDFNPYLSKVTMSNLDIMSINADGSISSTTGYVADSRAAVPPDMGKEKTQEEDGKTAGGETGTAPAGTAADVSGTNPDGTAAAPDTTQSAPPTVETGPDLPEVSGGESVIEPTVPPEKPEPVVPDEFSAPEPPAVPELTDTVELELIPTENIPAESVGTE